MLARGNHGITYSALDTYLQRSVVIKEYFPRHLVSHDSKGRATLLVDARADEFARGLKRFQTAATRCQAIKLSSYARIINYFELNDTAYLVTERVNGDPIYDALDAKPALSEPALLEIFRPLIEVVGAIHSVGVAHGNLRESNILLTPAGLPVVSACPRSHDQKHLDATRRARQKSTQFARAITDDFRSLATLFYEILLHTSDAHFVPDHERTTASRDFAGRYTSELLGALDYALDPVSRADIASASQWLARFPQNRFNAAVVPLTFPTLVRDSNAGGLAPSGSETAPGSESAAMNFAALRVLVIDDDRFARRIAATVLTQLGVGEIAEADGGRVALEAIQANDAGFDVALCDLRMPDMDGLEFVRRLSETQCAPEIIFASGADSSVRNTAEIFARQHGLTVLGALTKPLSQQALKPLLAECVQAGAQLKPSRRFAQAVVLTREEVQTGLSDGALQMYYQPQISVKTREVVGLEALARWSDPVHGVLGPGAFLPTVEGSDLMPAFTKEVIKSALENFALWKDVIPGIKLSINVSAQDLSDLRFPGYVVDMAIRLKISLDRITLEITESGVSSDAIAAMEILTRLRLHDITLSIDDFGTGYASLDKLKQLPFSELKIDRTFVNGAARDNQARALLESTSSLARKLELHIVAEGVEDQDDWDIVEEMGCDTVQGFFVAKPMPPNEVVAWIRKWNSRHLSQNPVSESIEV